MKTPLILLVLGAALAVSSAPAATITLQPAILGPAPDSVGCNFAHWWEGTNTADWWDYFGVKSARVFVSPNIIEPADDIPGHGDGVVTRDDFFTRRGAMNANALNNAYINWPYFENNYNNAVFSGGNQFKLAPAFSSARALGIDILVNITASLSRFTIASSEDWAGKWELWQHYYAQAFHLARHYDVRRYSIFNEPNHEAAGGITQAQWQERLELASDAIQRAVAEVNKRYGKSLSPLVYAPTTAGHNETIWNAWGKPAVQRRHRKPDGYNYTDYLNFHVYTFQNYGANGHTNGSTFTDKLFDLHAKIPPLMPGESPFQLALTEFNSLPNYIFQETAHSMDTPQRYAQLGSIAARLAAGFVRDMYVFKFGQTASSGTNYPITKNGLFYTDNSASSPTKYQYGGISKAGETYRLFARAVAPGRNLHAFAKGAGLDAVDVLHVKDPATQTHYVFLANTAASSVSIGFDTAALGALQDRRVTISEVSPASHGGVVAYTRVNANAIAARTLPARSVWLVTIAARPIETAPDNNIAVTVNASHDTMVKDGSNKNQSYGSSASVLVKNDPATPNGRNAGFLRFELPSYMDVSKIEYALLSVTARTANGTSGPAPATVYGLTNDSWAEGALTWATAPGLRQNVAAGSLIRNGVATGQGTVLKAAAQLQVNSGANTEYLVDVTRFVKTQTDRQVSLLILQDPRRDITINPSGPLGTVFTGDTLDNGQTPDGITIVSKEGAAAAGATPPRLIIVRHK